MNIKRVALRTMFAVFVALTGTFTPPASAEVVRAVEYYHQTFEHYFVTSNAAEIAALDSGAVSGWWRTGQRYRVDDAPSPGLEPVCRFFTAAYAGKASHFFTASATECEHVKTMTDWTYEGVAFYARLPDAQGNCEAGTAAIHRLFNNGQGGAPNHAYTADAAKVSTLVGAGWVSEGIAFCTPLAAGDPVAQLQVLVGTTWFFPNGGIETQFAVWPGDRDPTYIDQTFSSVGLPTPAASIDYKGFNSIFLGASTWDPLSDSYVAFGDTRFETGFVNGPAGAAWTFDSALGQSTPVCAMAVWENFLGEPDTRPLHPFQPYLWSGCDPRAGVAYRL